MTYCVLTPAATRDPEAFRQWCRDRGLLLIINHTPMVTLENRFSQHLPALIAAGWIKRVCGVEWTAKTRECLRAGQ